MHPQATPTPNRRSRNSRPQREFFPPGTPAARCANYLRLAATALSQAGFAIHDAGGLVENPIEAEKLRHISSLAHDVGRVMAARALRCEQFTLRSAGVSK